jgi:lipoprotein NlpD
MLQFIPRFLSVAANSPALRRLAAGGMLLALAACASRTPAPIEDRAPLPMPAPVAVTAPAPTPEPEPDWRPPTYTVKRGDTLHAIALDHGLDYREVAAWNNIENPNVIRVGQVLQLAAPGASGPVGAAGVTTMPLMSVPPVVSGEARPSPTASATPPAGPRNTENYKLQPKALKEPYSEQALREMQRVAIAPPAAAATATAPTTVAPTPATPTAAAPSPATPTAAAPSPVGALPPAPALAVPPAPVVRSEPRSTTGTEDDDGDEKIEWVWPAKGKLVSGTSDTSNLKGIDIAGTAGAPVVASAGGKVVYAGTGLRGYGKLVIVKHNGTFLSAYAHNRDILVKEGQPVTRGQKIAEMGNTDADQVKLHFEIRRHGKPVDPLKYLPPA